MERNIFAYNNARYKLENSYSVSEKKSPDKTSNQLETTTNNTDISEISISIYECQCERDEAGYVTDEVVRLIAEGVSPENIAVVGIHEGPVLLEVGDLLHDVDPCYAVLVPHRVLLETAVIEALGDEVRAVSSSALVAVI